MIKILNIIGARPQIIKAAAISRAIKNYFSSEIEDIIVHTGQHYDHNMSEVFFEELQIPKPHFNLNVGSASHAKQTANILVGIEEIIVSTKPHCVILYGDTNSTVAASLAAAKIHCPIVHIEAGLRSFNKSMPEELNRIFCDHSSTLLFAPTKTAIQNLSLEGFNLDNQRPFNIDNPGVFYCGDVMYDNSLYFAEIAEQKSEYLNKHRLVKDSYILATVHRDLNTDVPERLNEIFNAFNNISLNNNIDFILPLHPRTFKILCERLFPSLYKAVINNKRIKIVEPASFLEMILLEKYAKMVITDSGGVQKESFFFKKPCIILRPETEWKELVECGAAKIADADSEAIITSFKHFNSINSISFPSFFGDGNASNFICSTILQHL